MKPVGAPLQFFPSPGATPGEGKFQRPDHSHRNRISVDGSAEVRRRARWRWIT